MANSSTNTSQSLPPPFLSKTADQANALIGHFKGNRTKTFACEKIGNLLDLHPKTIMMISLGGYAGKKTQADIETLYKKYIAKPTPRKPTPRRISITFPDDPDFPRQLRNVFSMEDLRQILRQAYATHSPKERNDYFTLE
jgi:hypothetical protein